MLEILNYQTESKGKVIGYVDVKVPILKPTVLLFRRIAHLSNNGKKWLNFPSFSKPSADGTSQFHRHYEFFDEGHNGKFMGALLEELKKYLVDNVINEGRIGGFQNFSNDIGELPF